ncbi:MAG: phosphatidate cytidylyltransferase [Deltaproteobacteria bacterium]|nr:phosphatidate cytidylyltransferase [Deltaproteobacteria bacterium]
MSAKETGQPAGRWLVAIVLIAPAVTAALWPNKLFILALTAALGTLAWREFSVNLLGRQLKGLFALALVGLYLTLAGAAFFGPDGQLAGLTVALALGGFYLMKILTPERGPAAVNLLGRYVMGQLYLSFLLSFALLVKQLDRGGYWLLFVMLVTALADTGAYYAGSRLQGPKLYPKISPKKTISGLLGGCLAAAASGALSANYLPGHEWTTLAALGFFLGLWGTAGDLFESAVKRAMGLKDTSNILQGHGGVWDRLDSLLFNLPPVYFFVNYVTWP